MSTDMFFRNTTWSVSNEHGKWQTGTNNATLDGAAQAWTALRMHTVRGSASVSAGRTTTVGPTAGQEIAAASHWISAPLAADVTISGTITFNLRMAESVATVNAGAQCVIERVDNLGAVISIVVNSEKGTELSTTEAAQNWTDTPTSTAFLKGDRIRFRVAANDAGGTLAAGTVTFWNSGLSGATGDSFVTFTETLTFASSFPTPTTTLYLTDTASDIDPGGGSVDTKEAWTARGGSTVTAVTNTTAGFTAPIQWTASAGGNTVEWYTKQLNAFTLGGVVNVNMHGLQSNAAANVSPRAEIAVCNSAGSVLSTWGANTVNTEFGVGDTAVIWNVAGDDTAVADTNRLRLRFYLDDAEAGAMGAAQTATMGYAGTGVGTGDTYMVFTESITEYSTSAPKPIKRNVGRPQAAQRASRW